MSNTHEPSMPTSAANASTSQDMVVCIHGYFGHPLVMTPLARRLNSLGFRTHCYGYNSIWQSIAVHAERFSRYLHDLSTREDITRLHIVAHSMGCIVTRRALLESRPTKLGRVLFLCPPNRGSHMATRFAPTLGWLSPTLKEICDLPSSWVNQLPATIAEHVSVGTIVATGDWVVARESTHLPGVDHVHAIRGMHAGILGKAETANVTADFLRHGSFDQTLGPVMATTLPARGVS